MKSVFDELELGIEMTQALNSHMDERQIRTKKDDMPSMQRFELSPTDMLKLNREPLLIVRYLSYNPVPQLVP